MDCLCCADGGAGPSTNNEEFLGSVCHLTASDGTPAKFPAEANRYLLYVIAGCPFAARPWAIQAIYGLPIRVIKLFPASHDHGWFFEATSLGEEQLVKQYPAAVMDPDPMHGCHHLKQLYLRANPEFKGVVSVPLLWDSKEDTAVSNASLGLSQMMVQQMKGSLATRNQDLQLFPSEEPKSTQHKDLLMWIHTNISTAVYRIHATEDGTLHDQRVQEYYTHLTALQDRIQETKKWLLPGESPTFCDIVLWISLVRLDLAYQWRFGLGQYNIREDFPRLQQYIQDVFSIDGIKETVFPRDIMALYFMTKKWTDAEKGRTLPMVPQAWATRNGFT